MQGWLELASARHSMGGSRVNTALLTLKQHSAATKVEVNYDNGISLPLSYLYKGKMVNSFTWEYCNKILTDEMICKH